MVLGMYVCLHTSHLQGYLLSLSSFNLKLVKENRTSGVHPDIRLPIFDDCNVWHLAPNVD